MKLAECELRESGQLCQRLRFSCVDLGLGAEVREQRHVRLGGDELGEIGSERAMMVARAKSDMQPAQMRESSSQ